MAVGLSERGILNVSFLLNLIPYRIFFNWIFSPIFFY